MRAKHFGEMKALRLNMSSIFINDDHYHHRARPAITNLDHRRRSRNPRPLTRKAVFPLTPWLCSYRRPVAARSRVISHISAGGSGTGRPARAAFTTESFQNSPGPAALTVNQMAKPLGKGRLSQGAYAAITRRIERPRALPQCECYSKGTSGIFISPCDVKEQNPV